MAALNHQQFDSHTPDKNPNENKLLGREVRVTGSNGTAQVKIVDRLPNGNHGDLDLSKAAFQQVVGDLDIGRDKVTWKWR